MFLYNILSRNANDMVYTVYQEERNKENLVKGVYGKLFMEEME